MKKHLLVVIGILLFLSPQLKLFSQNSLNSLEFFEKVTGSYDELKKETWQYLRAVTRGKSARKIEKKRETLLSEIRNVKSQVELIPAATNREFLKNKMLYFYDISYIVLNEDYEKILDLEEIAEQSYDLMEAYLMAQEQASEKLESAVDTIQLAIMRYAAMNNITLIEGESDKLSQKIEKASNAIEYYNDVFLIFFKCHLQEQHVLEALNNEDISAFEQNFNALLSYSEEGIVKLNNMESYEGDPNLKISARKVLYFYKNEAQKDFPKISEYFIAKDNFETIKNKVESIRKKDLSQQNIDKYNKAVNVFNAKVKSFNQVLEKTNKMRSSQFKTWDNQRERFFNVHAN